MAKRKNRISLKVNLLHRQLLAAHRCIAGMKAAIYAAIYTVVGYIERREEDNAPAVDTFLDFLCERIKFMFKLLVVYLQQNSRFAVGEPVTPPCLIQNGTNCGRISGEMLCLLKRT